jgi:SHS2 domain-containing protein
VRGHREIEHTADLGFEVWADTVPGLFEEATRALAELCYDRSAVERRGRRAVEVTGDGREQMLVAWLQEVYLLLEAETWLTDSAAEVRCDGRRVRGILVGEPFDRRRHTLHTEIKAVTYHGLSIERDAEGRWRTIVIVDV